MGSTVETQDELGWIQKAKVGDQRAFSRLVERYQQPVFNLCYRMLGNGPEAEDAAQETFLRAYCRLNTYDEGRKFSSWLLSIASHYCIDCLRRRRFTWLDVDELIPVLSSDRRDEQPERAYLRREADRDVQGMLKELSPTYRSVVILRYWHELSYAEISDVLGLSEPAVKTRLHRARKALAEFSLAAERRREGLRTTSALNA